MEHLVDIRCRSCHRRIGYGPVPSRVYCDMLCYSSIPANEFEDRDSVMEALYYDSSLNQTDIARKFGMTRQRSSQILRRRIAR